MNYPKIYDREPELIFFCDLETTGFDYWRNEILTISIESRKYNTLDYVDRFSIDFKPHNLEYYGGVDVHGISLSRALNFRPKLQSTNDLFDWLISHQSFHNVFCCHALYRYNTYFDWAFLLAHAAKVNREFQLRKLFNKLESTIDFYKALQDSGKISVDNFKLNHLCDRFGIQLQHHDADSDMEACRDLYIKGRKL